MKKIIYYKIIIIYYQVNIYVIIKVQKTYLILINFFHFPVDYYNYYFILINLKQKLKISLKNKHRFRYNCVFVSQHFVFLRYVIVKKKCIIMMLCMIIIFNLLI